MTSLFSQGVVLVLVSHQLVSRDEIVVTKESLLVTTKPTKEGANSFGNLKDDNWM